MASRPMRIRFRSGRSGSWCLPLCWAPCIALFTVTVACAGDWETFGNASEPKYHTLHAGPNNTVLSASPVDTVYIGYSHGNSSASNPWSVRSTLVSPSSQAHRPPHAVSMWNWEPEGEAGPNGYVNGDPLQGWWPLRMSWRYLTDRARPLYDMPSAALDFGNIANYAPVSGRTFGVVGVWHQDAGNGAAAANGVAWPPLVGAKSAWCGLRRHGDIQYVDPITGVPFNEDVGAFATVRTYSMATEMPSFPGYMDGWDQMLYRDIDMSSNPDGDLTLHFMYRTGLSTRTDIAGWFDRDPLSVTASAGLPCADANFICGADGRTGPADSMMIYIGAPAEDVFTPFGGACEAAPVEQPISDPLRRWFDQVLRANEPTLFRELESTSGVSGTLSRTVTIPNSELVPMRDPTTHAVRLVFRVKTNGYSSDQSDARFDSKGVGAAIVDDVTFSIAGGAASPAGWGDFEAGSAIDNTKTALQAWRSTGKPPKVMTHVDQLDAVGVPYDDLCGVYPQFPGRLCSMAGSVLAFGDAGDGNRIGRDVDFTADHEVVNGAISPTIQLRGPYPNAQGVNATDATLGDMYMDFEVYAANATSTAPPVATGVAYRWLVQSYPLLGGHDGTNPTWGNIIRSYANYQTDPTCFRSLTGVTGGEGHVQAMGMLKYSPQAAQQVGVPDSVRIGWMLESTCYQAGVNACNAVGGVYIDNVSLAIVSTRQRVWTEMWSLWQDAFPWNEGVPPSYAASFDTAGAFVKSALNIAPVADCTFDVPGDSITVRAAGTSPMRVDLVFRILPGPGNYRIAGLPASGLVVNPQAGVPTTGAGRTVAVPNVSSSNFWESFLAHAGPFGTPGGHSSGAWNPNVWNSARCDTAEISLFVRDAYPPYTVSRALSWMSTYHEEELGIGVGDPYTATTVVRSGLGLLRHKCFLAADGAEATDVDCVHDPPTFGPGYDLTWVTATGSGYNGSPVTKEGTKVIPDGLLTPGAHVEYFWRVAEGGATTMVAMMPDTNRVVPQIGEGNADAHRWQAFSILPDRWKQQGYVHPLGLPVQSPACMLVVDGAHRGGDLAAWSGIADTIGATHAMRWGAGNGWHARGGTSATPIVDVNLPASNRDAAGRVGFISEHVGSPGSTWDLYAVTGAENTSPAGSFGARYACSDPSNSQLYGKRQQSSPTLDQLRAFYRTTYWFSGALNALVMGPQNDRSSDDQQLVKDWLISGSTSSANRAFWATGSGFVQSNERDANPANQHDFNVRFLGATYADGLGGSGSGGTFLEPVDGSALDHDSGAGVSPSRQAVVPCNYQNDEIFVDAGGVAATLSMRYRIVSPPFTAFFGGAITKAWAPISPWIAQTDGWDLVNLQSFGGADLRGRLTYANDVLRSVFPSICALAGTPIVSLDVATSSGTAVAEDFMALANVPLRSGVTRVHFVLHAEDFVTIRIFDIGGRLVRTLAERRFPAGEHDLPWDGSDDRGRLLRGVFFTQWSLRDRGFKDVKKIVVVR